MVRRGDYDRLFPSRIDCREHISTRQYARPVERWIRSIDLLRSSYSTHSLRRTKANLIYRKTGNLRTIQLLLGHSKIDSTVRFLGVEVEDALALAESIDRKCPLWAHLWTACIWQEVFEDDADWPLAGICSAYLGGVRMPLAIMRFASEVPNKSSHSKVLAPKWVVLIR